MKDSIPNRIQAGNPEVQSIETLFAAWVDEYTDPMVHFSLRYISDIDICMDLVQEAFLSAYSKIHTFDRSKDAKTWLFAIARNKCIDYIRKEKIRRKYSEDTFQAYDKEGRWRNAAEASPWETESNLLDNPQFLAVYESCIEKLPGYMPDIIKLRYIKEDNATKICEDLQISKANYWQLVHRAKLRLRKCLELNWFGNKE